MMWPQCSRLLCFPPMLRLLLTLCTQICLRTLLTTHSKHWTHADQSLSAPPFPLNSAQPYGSNSTISSLMAQPLHLVLWRELLLRPKRSRNQTLVPSCPPSLMTGLTNLRIGVRSSLVAAPIPLALMSRSIVSFSIHVRNGLTSFGHIASIAR